MGKSNKRRGRKPTQQSLLSVRIRQRLDDPPPRLARLNEELAMRDEQPIESVDAVERHLGLPKDALRDILRGRVGRNKQAKLVVIERVASFLDMPFQDLAALAGLVTLDRRKIDFGTPEAQLRRQRLANGGDPRLCSSALGVLLARNEVAGEFGITHSMHNAGERFGLLAKAVSCGASPGRYVCPLGRVAHEFDSPPPPPTEARRTYAVEAYSSACQVLRREDSQARTAILAIGSVSNMVMSVAVNNVLPPFAFDDGARHLFVGDWLALRVGLRAISRFFRSDAHAEIWSRFKTEDEIEQFGYLDDAISESISASRSA